MSSSISYPLDNTSRDDSSVENTTSSSSGTFDTSIARFDKNLQSFGSNLDDIISELTEISRRFDTVSVSLNRILTPEPRTTAPSITDSSADDTVVLDSTLLSDSNPSSTSITTSNLSEVLSRDLQLRSPDVFLRDALLTSEGTDGRTFSMFDIMRSDIMRVESLDPMVQCNRESDLRASDTLNSLSDITTCHTVS